MIPVFCCNHDSSEILELFCKYFLLSFCYCFINLSELSQLFTALSSDEFTNQQQNDNKKILAKRFQNFTGMMITAKDWNHSDYQHNLFGSLEQSKQENLGIIELAWAHNAICNNWLRSTKVVASSFLH